MKVRATSREAYYALEDLGQRQQAVYHTIRGKGTACNLDIAYILHQPINRITPRTNELVQAGLIVESHRAVIQQRIEG